MKKRASALCLAAAIVTAPIFGQFGGVVSDPVQEAHSASQLLNDITKLQRALQLLQLAQQMAVRLGLRSRFLTTAVPFVSEINASRYGEAVNWSAAMNGAWYQTPIAYGNVTTQLSPLINLASERLGSSYQLANLATVETMDASNTACLQAVSQYRGNQNSVMSAFGSLSGVIIDESDATNGEIGQLNELNSGSAQQNTEALSRGTLQACLVEQQGLANTVTRNNEVEAFNMFAQVQQMQASNPMELSNMSTSLNAVIQ